MSLEETWYEASPYLYGVVAVPVLLWADGPLAKASGGLLLIAAATVIRLRWRHRHARPDPRARARALREARELRRARVQAADRS